MRVPLVGVGAGVVAIVLGVAGFVRGAVPQSAAPDTGGRVVVTSASVVAGAGTSTTGMFTVYNTTAKPDRVADVASGAGAQVALPANVVIPARGSLVVRIVISQLFGALGAGQTVDLQIDFAVAPSATVQARVVAQANQGQSPQPSSGAPS